MQQSPAGSTFSSLNLPLAAPVVRSTCLEDNSIFAEPLLVEVPNPTSLLRGGYSVSEQHTELKYLLTPRDNCTRNQVSKENPSTA